MRMSTITREQLEARLQAADRPLLVDFYQQRCAPCHTLDRQHERTGPAPTSKRARAWPLGGRRAAIARGRRPERSDR